MSRSEPLVDTWVISADIDECTLETDDCAQICTNTPGSYECACESGYTSSNNGRTCEGRTYSPMLLLRSAKKNRRSSSKRKTELKCRKNVKMAHHLS